MFALLLQISLAWLIQVMLPGPNFLMVSQQAVRLGRRSAVLTVLGISTGAAIWATAALIGFSSVLTASGEALRVLRVVGGLVIVLFGIRLFMRPEPQNEEEALPQRTGSAYLRGIMTSLSNPKAAVYFASLFVAALPADIGLSTGAIIVVAISSVSSAWYGVVAFGLSNERARAWYSNAAGVVDRLAGAIFVVLGGRLALSAVSDR